MKLTLSDNINPYYAETLCLLFFPGSKFSDDADDGHRIDAVLIENDTEYVSTVTIDGVTASATLSKDETLSRPSMAKKIVVGRAFLAAGKDATGIAPPWGILTGVRPSKLALAELDSGKSVNDAALTMTKDYSVTPEKARLACDVALAERALITPDLRDRCSVYIAIPFCPSRCSYCSFVSFTSEKLLSLIPDYLEVLLDDIKRTSELIKRLGIGVSTVYIGGGTPTVLEESQLERLLSVVDSSFDLASISEFTLEAGRPDTITAEKFKSAKRHGVTRVSVNTQTLNDYILESIGRRHTAFDFFKAFDVARATGIRDVNVDLIAGLPGESPESFIDAASRVAVLRPENVTVHTFCVKKSAEIKTSGVYSAECAAAQRSVDSSRALLMEQGYLPYYMYRQKNAVGNLENVGYTLPGREGIYNILMMEEIQSIFAVGASAVSKLVRFESGAPVIKRIAECKYPFEYLREAKIRRDDGKFPLADEALSFFGK